MEWGPKGRARIGSDWQERRRLARETARLILTLFRSSHHCSYNGDEFDLETNLGTDFLNLFAPSPPPTGRYTHNPTLK